METTTATAETVTAAVPAQPQPHSSVLRFSAEQLVQLVAALEEPFDRKRQTIPSVPTVSLVMK